MYNPEKSFLEKEDNNAVENVEYILDHQLMERIDESDFDDIYKEKDILKDKDYVERMKQNFRESEDQLTSQEREKVKERKKKSEALEIIIGEQGTMSGWFEGGDIKSSIVRTGEYDDIRNGVDSVVEFEIPDKDTKTIRRIALAIDASMSADASIIDRKIKRNMERIDNLDDLHIKYFQSDIEDYKGELNGIMPVVFALDGKHTNDLINLAAQNKRLVESGNNNEIFKETKEKLDNHPCQLIFLREARMQFEAYAKKLQEMPEPKAKEILGKVQQDLEIINTLIEEKKDIDFGELMDDNSFARVEELIMPKEKFNFST